MRNRLVGILCSVVVLGLCVSCGSSDEPSEPAAALPPAPAVSEVIFSGDIKGIETVPGKGDTVVQVKEGDVPAVALSSKGIKREPDGDGDSGILRLTPDLSSAMTSFR